jgi:endonuclease III
VRDAAFQSWWVHDDPHLLWIHGDPGKGKTMMMFSLYSEISSRIKATGSGAVVSYFFCQRTDPRLDHAVAVLRGLIFLLVAQDKQTLLPHLREKLDETEDLEGSSNLLYALFQMLIDLSIESRFSKVYIMIDALDECNSELSPFLGEIARSESLSYKIKWLVTSRNEALIRKGLSSYERPCLTLELKSTYASSSKSTTGAKATDLEQTKKRKRSPKRTKVAEAVTCRLDALPNGLGEEVDKEGKPKENHAPGKKAVKTSDAAYNNVDDLIDVTGNIPKKERKQKAHTYGLTPGYSPFPNHSMPTPKACEEVARVLSELYGEVGPLPSIDVAGCSEIPDLLGAILGALLRASTTTNNFNMALKGLQDTFGLRESGKNKGSINWEAVLRADLLVVIEAIKSGGFAKVKGTNIKKILDTVYKQNRERRDTLVKEKDKETGKPSDIASAGHEVLLQKDTEITDENLLSMDYVLEMTTDEAMEEMITLPGIGVETASRVVLFCMRRPSFAVDTHVWRHCKWLGWVPEKATRDQTFSHCEVRVPDHLKYPLHQLFHRHSKTCGRCRANNSVRIEEWESTTCPIEHLVTWTGKKKILRARPEKKAKTSERVDSCITNSEQEFEDDRSNGLGVTDGT